MAISQSLSQFKHSQVARLEFDRTQIVSVPSNTLRLVIGFSKKGQFNTPVFIRDSKTFKDIYGEIDLALEKKGSFFHRTVLTCLERGPVIVMNLLALDDSLDKSQFKSVSTSATMANSATVTSPVSSFFNKDKFWFTSGNTLVDYANNGTSQGASAQRLLNFANVGRKTISVLTKKTEILGFDILAKDWYGVGKVPDYINENDYMVDYMLDIAIVNGDFSNYDALSVDPIFGPFFDSSGLKKTYVNSAGVTRDALVDFLALELVEVIGVYTVSLIPGFIDKTGENLYIEDVINRETSRTNLLVGLDDEKIDDDYENISGNLIDLVGHSIDSEQPTELDFLSYYGSIVSQMGYTGSTGIFNLTIAATAGQTGANALLTATTITGGTGWVNGYYDTLLIYGPGATLPAGFTSSFTNAADFSAFREEIAQDAGFIKVGVTAGPYNLGTTGNVNFSKINSNSYSATTDILTVKIALTADSTVVGPTNSAYSYYYINGLGITATGTASLPIIKSVNKTFGDGIDLYGFVKSDLYADNLNGIITDGDKLTATGAYLEFTRLFDNNFSTTPFGATCLAAGVFGSETPILSSVVNYVKVDAYINEDFTGATTIPVAGVYNIDTLKGSINQSFEIWGGTSYANPTTTIWLDNSAAGPYGLDGYTGKIKKGQYLVVNFGGTGSPTTINPLTGKSRLTKVISVSETVDPLSATYKKIKVVTNEPIYIKGGTEVERYDTIDNFADHYRFHTLNGYTLRAAQMPDGTRQRQNEILDVIYNTGIFNALIDREVILYRYIVDSFEGLIEDENKSRLTKIAKAQKSCLAICNMPSCKQFRESTVPLFKETRTSEFDPKYISFGGNLDFNPTVVFSMPTIENGANYGSWYGPYITLRENGRNFNVPPAAHVSNLYIDKYNLGVPYAVVAGPRRGVISGSNIVGVEYAFDSNNLDYIEPFGYNAIVNRRGSGLTINANQTGQQNVKSALSQIHVRELLIYIQDGIESILKNYRWEFNTAQVRLEIKTLADNFMGRILADGGVYSFVNVMDTTNNTNEVITANTAILDTYIEPSYSMGLIIHRTTLLKPGVIATGNFI